jgi:hypothetical protein
MSCHILARWTLELDPSATAKAYSVFSEGDSERCGCNGCLNIIASRDSMYPDSVATFMKAARIPRDREVRVGHFGEIRDLVHVYDAAFPFIGSIIDGADARTPRPDGRGWWVDLEPINDAFKIGVTSHLQKLPDSFPPELTLQLELQFELPWLLDPDLSA